MASMGDIIFTSMVIAIVVFSAIIILILALGAGNNRQSPPRAQSDNKWPVANLGQDLLLSCYLPFRPASDVSVTWTKQGHGGLVYCFRHGISVLKDQDAAFQDRTHVFPDAIVRGNVSLLLRRVRQSDQGVYSCQVDTSAGGSSLNVDLKVAAFSVPSFTYSSDVLTATAQRWLPKPTVTWLDHGGKVLTGNTTFSQNSAGIFSLVSSLHPVSSNSTYVCRIQSSVVIVVGEATITDRGVAGRNFVTYGSASPLATSKQMSLMSTCLLLSITSLI